MSNLRFILLLTAIILAFVGLMADQLEGTDFASIIISTVNIQ